LCGTTTIAGWRTSTSSSGDLSTGSGLYVLYNEGFDTAPPRATGKYRGKDGMVIGGGKSCARATDYAV